MLQFLNKHFPFNQDFIRQIKIVLGISLGLFLFILFFQPIDPAIYDFNNKLLIIAGFGVITFLILSLMLIVLPSIFLSWFVSQEWNLKKDLYLNFLIWMLISTAFTFYSLYVGNLEIDLYLIFKILLLGLLPVIFLIILNQNLLLRNRIEAFINVEKEEENRSQKKESNGVVTFESESQSDSFIVKIDSIIFIKSANNYIEIFYKDRKELKKRLIRNTLNKAEYIINDFPFLIRCHRTSIINLQYIDNIDEAIKDNKIHLKEFDLSIAVSRQYLLNVKKALINL